MTDYSEARSFRCKKCGVSSCDVDPACDCQMQKDEYHDCPECGLTLDAEIFPKLRACYDHEEDIETLREMIDAEMDITKNLKTRLNLADEQIYTLKKLVELYRGYK